MKTNPSLNENNRHIETTQNITQKYNHETKNMTTSENGANGTDKIFPNKSDQTQPHTAYASLFRNLPNRAQNINKPEIIHLTTTPEKINQQPIPGSIYVDLTLTDKNHNDTNHKTIRNTTDKNNEKHKKQQQSENETRRDNNTNINNESEFRGVYREKKKRLFVDNIHKTSTFYGLLDYLKNTKKLHPSGLKLFKSKRSGHQAAKIHLYPEEAEQALSDDFWPRGVTCEYWLTREEVIKRGNINTKQNQETFKGRDNSDDDNYSEYENTHEQNKYKRRNRYKSRRNYETDYEDEDYKDSSYNDHNRYGNAYRENNNGDDYYGSY